MDALVKRVKAAVKERVMAKGPEVFSGIMTLDHC